MLSIVFLDRDTLPPAVTLRRPAFAHEWVDFSGTTRAEVAARAAGAHVVITNKVPVDGDAIARLSSLRLIAVAATGYDMVDVAAARARGIVVANIRGYAVHSVPEHTFALMLALRRSLLAYADAVRRGRWQEAAQFAFFDFPIADLHGARLGIIGRGAIGSRVAKIAEAFGAQVLLAGRKGARPGPGQVDFADVLAESDILTLHCPLTAETRGLIAAPEFRAMARRPLLINTARGGLVDERALSDALVTGRISGAGFDVSAVEPPLAASPLMALVGRPDFLLTPHVAWASRSAMQALADQLIDNIEAFARGAPRNVVA